MLGGTLVLDGRELRGLAAAGLAAAAVLPLLPGEPGLPCPLRTLTGVPCPLCGTTTSAVATVHLDLADALAANPAGVALVVASLAVLLLRPALVRLPSVTVPLALGLLWLFELRRFSIL